MTRCRSGSEIRRQRLLKSTVDHSYLVQKRLLHQFRKRLAAYIHYQLLQDDIAATGVTKFGAGRHVDANRSGVSRLLAVQYLPQSWEGFADFVTEKSRYCYARSVRQQPTNRYLLLFRELVLWDFP